jgi:hypothetical protein
MTLLAAYDAQLRDEAEVDDGSPWDRDGPLVRAVFDGRYGFVTYRALDGYDGPADGARLDGLIARTVAHFRDQTNVVEFEWKTRGHDRPADLALRLEEHGLVARDLETVMVGEVSLLTEDRPVPDGVTIRRLGFDPDGTAEPDARLRADVDRMLAMQREVFGSHGPSEERTVRRIQEQPYDVEVWVAEAGEGSEAEIVCAGQLILVPGSEFAGVWGGATAADWRGRGVYRALTATRARAAAAKGVRYLHSDCSALSRPILERSGLVAITTSTPYVWTRPA